MTHVEIGGEPLEVATEYIGMFAARTDVYAVHGDDHWAPVRLPLTPRTVARALEFGPGLSFYYPGRDGQTIAAGVDFDGEDGWGQALELARAMWAIGIPAYVEHSRRGGHVWLSIEARLQALTVRRALRSCLTDAGLSDRDPKIELRPATDQLSNPQGLGHALRAPMMRHPATGVAYPLVDPRTGVALGGSLREVLAGLERAPVGSIVSAAERWRAPQPAGCRRGSTPQPMGRISVFNARVGVSDVLQAAGAGWARSGRSGRCPFHDDRHPSMSIAADDKRAWCHSPSCPAHRDGKGVDAWDLARLRLEATP